jgi:dTDP-4-dehydrorhamnose reductase
MSLSFKLCPHLIRSKMNGGKKTILVTGAAGNIGSYFAEHAGQKYDLRLLVKDESDAEQIKNFGKVVLCDVTSLDQLKPHFNGVDTVLHLAANPSPNSTWDSVRDLNIGGTYNVFAAAKEASVRRVVYASSIHAVSGYPNDTQVKTSDPVNPGDLYGVSKCFGEALARYMAEQEGLSSICLRIGAFQPLENAKKPDSLKMLDAWVSPRDLQQLIEKCIDDDRLQFAIFNGLSNNRFKRLDISDARELLNYAPQDDLSHENPQLSRIQIDQPGHNLRDPSQKSGLREDVASSTNGKSAP